MQEPILDSNAFRAIVDSQIDGVVILGQNNIIQYLNPAAKKLLFSISEDAVGERFNWALKKKKVMETKITTSEGESKVIQLYLQDTQWEDEPAFLVSVKDITDQKSEEQLLHRAIDAAEERAAELEAIKFIADQLNQAAMLEEAIESGLETVLALIGATAVWILLPEESENTNMVVIYDDASLLKSEKRLLGPTFRCGGLDLHLQGELLEPVFITEAGCVRQAGLSSHLPEEHWTVPLIAKGKRIGVLNLAMRENTELNESKMKLLKNMSQQLAMAIFRSRSFSDSSKVLERDEALGQVSRTISSALDLPTVLQNIVHLAIELVGADAGSIGLLTPNGQHITFLANFPEDVSPKTMSRRDDLVWDVIKMNQPVLVTQKSEAAARLPEDFCIDATDLILVPIFTGRETLGVLVLYTKDEDRKLTEFDLALIESLGQQAGIAVQNAQLFFEVQQLTMSDSLTGVNNQKSFINLAVKELERAWRYKRPLSLISMVIDDIRKINDDFGFEAGDKVLRAVAVGCTNGLRRVDIIGRYQGNNFTILLPETDREAATDVADRLRRIIEKSVIKTGKSQFSFTVSLGVSNPMDNELIDLERLIDRANHALYTAVQAGGNQTIAWNPGSDLI
ncbi:MAG: diguanylate cyclase [Anaerolineaceae bacterium]|nr:diguanylate cyclase [Anaerolineaceae bacterium]